MTPNIDSTLTDSLSSAATKSEMAATLFEFMRQKGQSFYDESITQLQHALQSAHLATQARAAAEQVTAALLHDIGHFLMDEHDEQSDFQEEDWLHETIGAEQLDAFFPQSVLEPIRLHVPAKRYLCTVEPDYYDALSPASQRSYHLQGGEMNEAELAEFQSHPHLATILLVRRWDDGAKVIGWEVPDLEAYQSAVESCLLRD